MYGWLFDIDDQSWWTLVKKGYVQPTIVQRPNVQVCDNADDWRDSRTKMA